MRQILKTINTDLFREQVDSARKLLDFEDISMDDGGDGFVSAKNIEDIYERRSGTPGAPEYIKAQCAKVAHVAGLFREEHWNIYGVERGEVSFLIFANEAGVGRACIDVTRPIDREAVQLRPITDSKMHYIRVARKHARPSEPVMLYSERDEGRWELRKVEVYRDGRPAYASATEKTSNTKLSESPLPDLEEVAEDPQFEPVEITRAEFEAQWAARKRSP